MTGNTPGTTPGTAPGAMLQLPLPEASFGRPVLPPGRDLAQWHAALSTEIATALSPAHAAILAVPVAGAGGIGWFAHGAAVRRFSDLSAEDRRALTAAAGVILSDIRRLAESQAALAVTTAWPALREVPDISHLFAVDGRPVLAGWGLAPASGMAGPMARLDDNTPFRPPSRTPWAVHGSWLVALAVLTLAAGLGLPMARAWITPAPPACLAAPGQTALLLEQARENERGRTLRLERARLEEELGRKQLACPIPRRTVPPATPPRSDPPPATPPRSDLPPATPPRSELPEDRWNRRDLAMLEGCWQLSSDIMVGTFRPDGSVLSSDPVRDWKMCFGRNGEGRQTVVQAGGQRCENAQRARFQEDQSVEITDIQQCRGGLQMVRGTHNCRRISDSEAECTYRMLEGPRREHIATARFRR